MRTHTLIMASVLSCGLAVASVLPAAAAQRTTTDPTGDATSTHPQGNTATFFDITKLKVDNKKSELVVKITAPGFVTTGDDAPVSYIAGAIIHTKGSDYYAEAAHTEGDHENVELSRADDESEGGEDCPGLRYVFRAGAAKIVIPQKCFGKEKGSVRVVALMRGYAAGEDAETVDYTNEHPRHVKRG